MHWLSACSYYIWISCSSRLSSWFGFHESVFNWFKSYLSFRSFRVKCHSSFSSSRISSCGVPQCSVLGPLLFSMYTTPLSTLILSLSLSLPLSLPLFKHHLYADDTQLFSALHGMPARTSDEKGVRLSNACIVTKRKRDLFRLLYHTKDHVA